MFLRGRRAHEAKHIMTLLVKTKDAVKITIMFELINDNIRNQIKLWILYLPK